MFVPGQKPTNGCCGPDRRRPRSETGGSTLRVPRSRSIGAAWAPCSAKKDSGAQPQQQLSFDCPLAAQPCQDERLASVAGASAMTETPETHYVKSDDVHIAYQVLGDGPFDLLFVPGFVSNVEAQWRSPDQSAFFRRLASFCRLILFDKRGTGMSDRANQDFTLEQRMHDVQAILDAIG